MIPEQEPIQQKKAHSSYRKINQIFCLCHNSFAVNLHAVRTYSHKGIILSDNTEIPVSRILLPAV